MDDILQDVLDVLQEQFFLGGLDDRAYLALKAAILLEQQRLRSCDIPKALDLYNAIKAVMDV